MATLTMVEAINLALRQEMEKDPRVLLLGEDVGKTAASFASPRICLIFLARSG
jgi:pyruvate dehydrogenase E1 component beta subunit